MASSSEDWTLFARCHKERDFGRKGVRRVQIRVMAGEKEAVHYEVDHFWAVVGPVCSSLLVLREPRGLSGTLVLMIESGIAEAVRVLLKLSTSRRAVQVTPERV